MKYGFWKILVLFLWCWKWFGVNLELLGFIYLDVCMSYFSPLVCDGPSFEMPTMVVAANARKRFVMLLVSHRQPPLSSLEKKQIAREDDNNSHPCDALNLHRRCVFTAKEEIKAVKSWVSASHCQCACAIAENQLGGSWIYDRGHCEGCFMLVCEKINTNPFHYNP